MFNKTELKIIKKIEQGLTIDWALAYYDYKFSEEFIRRFSDKVIWWAISAYQKLSEPFIEEFQDKVDWQEISYHQKLSKKFIIKFQDKICFDYIPFVFINKNHERSWKTFL